MGIPWAQHLLLAESSYLLLNFPTCRPEIHPCYAKLNMAEKRVMEAELSAAVEDMCDHTTMQGLNCFGCRKRQERGRRRFLKS